MSNFASFRKCDLQIHSCRDPGWHGPRPVGVGDVLPSGTPATKADVDQMRQQWAASFIDMCVKKGLSAVAITDHHEMVMTEQVVAELDARGKAGKRPDLWFFPGMELTLKDGVQAIILFDADLPRDIWIQAQGRIGIGQSPEDAYKASAKQPTQLAHSYDELAELLDALPALKNRYIILPNVSAGGQHTVVRTGWHSRFRSMPYVGGYMDAGQNITTCSASHKQKLSGEDANWGDRFIYPLPTSDCRDATFGKVGTNNAWLKLSLPTAESIRQAFLAWQSRIRIEEPKRPAIFVKSITVVGANPLSDVSISLSPELNAFIGGRGSGKSSLLEYVAFGLGRSCHDLTDKAYSGLKRLQELIKDTAISEQATISIVVSQDGADFEVVRGPATGYRPQVKYPNGQVETLSDKELRAIIPAFTYSQGELSELGSMKGATKITDLLAFIEAAFKTEADAIEAKIVTAKRALSDEVRRAAQKWHWESEKAKATNRLNALTARISGLQKSMPKMDPADQAVVDNYGRIVLAGTQVKRAADDLQAAKDASGELNALMGGLKPIATEDIVPQLEPLQAVYKTSIAQLQKLASQTETAASSAITAAAAPTATWDKYVADEKIKHDKIIEKVGAQKAVAKQIAELQATHANEVANLQNIDRQIAALGDPFAALKDRRAALSDAVGTQVEKLVEWGKRIEELSQKTIRVQLEAGGDLSEVHAALEIISARTRSKEPVRIQKFGELVESAGVWKALNQILGECILLLRWKTTGADPNTQPNIEGIKSVLGDSDAVVQSFIEQLDLNRVVSLVEAVPRVSVQLKYHSDGKEIAFEKASEGQRAAVLLMMLLKQGGGPLLIDQPEGDLDNSVIKNVVELLHDVRHLRQLIFATHSASLVVNGSAELVAVLANNALGRRSIENSGAIDQPEVRGSITETMEGGREAFKDRQRKYGF